MKRLPCAPRADWAERVEAVGFDFHTIDGAVYWDESGYWEFTAEEIDTLDDAATELHFMCMDAVARVIDDEGGLARLGITGLAADLARESWFRHDPHVYGRFDLAWTGDGPLKLLEYNSDTPTSLFEAAVVQWQWLQDFAPEADQFNSIHEALVERWGHVALGVTGRTALHMACMVPHAEDEGTIGYLQATALEAGLSTKRIAMSDIGWNGARFVDLEEAPIQRLFKLYPWEWMIGDDFARFIGPSGMRMIEPAWKMVLSGKGLLPLLWEMYPGHPNLLPASFRPEDLPGGGRMVRKPLWGREGANVAILDDGLAIAHTEGPYGGDGYIHQAWTPLASKGDAHAVFGAWMIGDVCRGLGIREDSGLITHDTSRFVPHLFIPS